MLVTAAQISYGRGTRLGARPVSSVGFGEGSGTLLQRYVARAPVAVAAARVWVAPQTVNVGKRIFGVVLDSTGHLLARSADYLIQTVDLGRFVPLPLASPARVQGAYFVGVAQPASASGREFFPVGFQVEARALVSEQAYYAAPGDSALTGLVAPQELREFGRLLLGADLTILTGLPTHAAALPPPALTVWPNPATEKTCR